MRKNLALKATLRKIQSEENIRISLIIKSTLKVVRISNPRIIRNGVARFYGETVSLPNSIGSFEFIILNGETDQCIAQLPVPKQVVMQFTTRRNAFCCQGGGFKLSWEAQYSSDNQNKNMDTTDRDLHDLEDSSFKGQCIVQPADKVRRRRKQIRNIDTISQPGEPHRHHLEGFSSATKARNLEKNIRQLDLAMENIRKPLFSIQEKELTSRKSTSKSKSKQKPTTINSHVSQKKQNVLTRISSQNELSVKKLTKISPPKKRLQRHRSGLIERFGVRQVVCTGLFGIITGLAAAQF